MVWLPKTESGMRHKNSLDAQSLLASMDMNEFAVADFDNKETESGKTDATVAFEREQLARAYRKAVGVWPSERQAFRAKLEEIAETGMETKEEILARFPSQPRLN